MIREEKVIKEWRKRKRSTWDLQSEAPLALKIVKASTLLNTNIPRTSFTGSEKRSESSVCPTASPEADIQTASSMPDRAKALIINMPMELKKG